MLSILLSKKTFGIKNETFLNLAANFYYFVVSALCLLGTGETIVHGPVVQKNPFASNVASFHLIGSICILFFTGYIFQVEEEKFTKRRSLFIGCVTIFHIVYLFNPWIAEYQKDAEEVYIIWHYTVKLHSIALYCCLVIAAFICWLPWQNQSMRKKPTYEVIYGDKDSVTKKLLDDCSV